MLDFSWKAEDPINLPDIKHSANTVLPQDFPYAVSSYVDTAGKNASRIAEYIKNQLEEDRMGETVNNEPVRPVHGQQVTILSSWQIVLARLTRMHKKEGFARSS
ncbi:hypothetical protein [Ligaoa zhengdingensis]|uniref:hypothetical protein n=1 Tax=Ligaoa zhengdingensis TaxID=2763658 RepID=UPI003CCEC3E5